MWRREDLVNGVHTNDGKDNILHNNNRTNRDSNKYHNSLHPTPLNTIRHSNTDDTMGPSTMDHNAMDRKYTRRGSSTMDRNGDIRGSVPGGDHNKSLYYCHR